MAMNKWAVVIVAIVAVGFFGLLTLAGVGYFVFTSHVDLTDATDEAAVRRTFEEARARFAGQPPLLTSGPDGPVLERSDRSGPRTELTSLHVMAWEEGEERMITLRIPVWIIRLGGNEDVDFDTDQGDPFTLDLTLEDLERHGPGLIVDYERAGHERVLIWTE